MNQQITFVTKFSPSGRRHAVRVAWNTVTNEVWTEVLDGAMSPDLVLAKRQLDKVRLQLRLGYKLEFCTEPDPNGNFFLFDINLLDRKYRMGYCFRYANRVDNIVTSKRNLHKLAEVLEKLGFERVNCLGGGLI